MAVKIIIIVASIAMAAADTYPAQVVPAAVTSQSGNILRSYGNLGQVSTYEKTIDTPYSSVSKSDIRVSNPGVTTYVSPAPVHETPLPYHHPLPLPAATVYHAPASPVAAASGQPLLGVAFSAAPAVSHMSFDGYGIQYTY
ncbi:cuticle protein 76-like [Lycorma delicatula]|uniref:cuticle protein 76-like n=1 Tax=Lycorma delicatula TaxID=130591 RepID=UPI003F50FD31